MECFFVFSAHCQCQQGWREYEHTCYYFSIDEQSWMEANQFCLEQNSDLMSIGNFHERVRSDDTQQHPKTKSFKYPFVVSHTGIIHFYVCSLVVAKDTNQHRELLDWPDWPNLRGFLGMEWWECCCAQLIVCTIPLSERLIKFCID